MNLDKIKEIIKILEESNIDEIEIKGLFTKIRVAKKRTPVETPTPSIPQVVSIPTQQQVEPIAEPKLEAVEKKEPPPEEKFVYIKSPMVGTFYRTSSPNSPPFVEVGDKVTPKKIVCIIEAMKIFNEIEAGVSGTIAEILVENGKNVEFGQPLFKIIPE